MIDIDFPAGPQVAVIHQQPCGRDCRKQVREARRQRRQLRRIRLTVRPYRWWLRAVRYCESGNHGLYRANTGNGFYGAYQFTLSSWYAVGGSGYPHQASPLEQDYRAVRLLHLQGPGAWPVCG
jgi:Transglycosylase-like domain